MCAESTGLTKSLIKAAIRIYSCQLIDDMIIEHIDISSGYYFTIGLQIKREYPQCSLIIKKTCAGIKSSVYTSVRIQSYDTPGGMTIVRNKSSTNHYFTIRHHF